MSGMHRNFQSLLAWQCGYTTGLRVALRLLSESRDPARRIESEAQTAMCVAKMTADTGPVSAMAEKLD